MRCIVKGAPEFDGFVGAVERLLTLADRAEAVRQVVEGHSQVGGEGVGVGRGEGAIERYGLAGAVERWQNDRTTLTPIYLGE